MSNTSLQCRISPLNSFSHYKYVVICTFYNDLIVLSKHKERSTWEHQGGHIEEGETPYEAAKRELYEESGITDALIRPVCDYTGYTSKSNANGVVFLAVVSSIGELPESEIDYIGFFESLPANLTYPNVTPYLLEKAKESLKKGV